MQKVLLTGANGYIGMRLLPMLVNQGYYIYCGVRDKNRFKPSLDIKPNYEVLELDVTKKETLSRIPKDIDVAFYLIHSMTTSTNEYDQVEAMSAENFLRAMEKTKVKQVLYLSAITNSPHLSKHFSSRKKVETILSRGRFAFTTLRAGIIIGSGSASFEIIRDLVEKLPVMVAPKWLNTRTQPIAIRTVLQYLTACVLKQETYNKFYDIGGLDILTYREMLLGYAKERGLKRRIVTLPFFSPRLSSYWLYFVTSVSYKLAVNLVNSMKVEVVCRKNNLDEILDVQPLTYAEALKLAFQRIAQNEIVSSWKDAVLNGGFQGQVSRYLQVPTHGCLHDERIEPVYSEKQTIDKIWKIGGDNGWYYANRLWELRGAIDKLFGGVGLMRGRRSPDQIEIGDSLDFWRVISADKKDKRLLLYAEMKLPGEAWLEFKIKDGKLYQKATFRPLGLLGRLYWFTLLPAHKLIFNNMARRIASQ